MVIPKRVDLPFTTTNDEFAGPMASVTSCALAGHTGLPAARIFERLDRLTVGDWFVIRVLGENHAYRVTKTEVVLPEEVSTSPLS